MTRSITHIHVYGISLRATVGLLRIGGLSVPCSFGRTGRRHRKREGDGATPIGKWQLRRIFYRTDRVWMPRAHRPARPLHAHDGWCETVGDRNYNRLVRLPYPAAHETMKRSDHLYDIVVELSHNERPRTQGRGSAVFFHLRRFDGGPTAGCIAVSENDMRKILSRCGPKTWICV